MGIFSKSRSTRTIDTSVKSYVVEKKRWKSSVRSYLCGDELLNSVLAEEDCASVRSSEATVTQPVPGEECTTHTSEDVSTDDSIETMKHESSEHDQSDLSSSFLNENDAAIMIQAAFRGFLVRRLMMSEISSLERVFFKGLDSSSRDSMGTSIEVQTGNSIGVVSIDEEIPCVSIKIQHKAKNNSVFRPKNEWDDSTLDSSASKMRIQNRLEAMTRRERALAYAFSQQLRICSKKKATISDSTEKNTGWSWLERWMATRQPEGLSADVSISKQLNEITTAMKTKPISKNFLDLSLEGKESCSSNEVPIQVDCSIYRKIDDKEGFKAAKNRLKAPRNISRRKTVPTGHYQKQHAKVNKRDGTKENGKNSAASRQLYVTPV